MQYVVKTSDIIEATGSSLMLREPPRFDGHHVDMGDIIYLWSSGKEGGLLGRGRVESVGRHLRSELELRIAYIDWRVIGSLTTADIKPYRDSIDGSAMAALSRLLYFHAHNKIAQLPENAADLLSGHFGDDEPASSGTSAVLSPPAPSLSAPSPAQKLPAGMLAATIGILAVVLAGLWLFHSSRDRQSAPSDATPTPSAPNPAPASIASTSDGTKVFSVSAVAGAPARPTQFKRLDFNLNQQEALRSEVTDVGYPCGSVAAAYQTPDSDDTAGLMRIECAEAAYQITLLNGKSYVKPWTGVALGSDN